MAHKFDKELEKVLTDQVMNGEVAIATTNMQWCNDDFEECVSLLDSERREKNYDWMSDIRIPEFASHMLTQASIDVGQYFQTRDFVEVYLQDESDEAKANSEASKELLNRTLNQRHLHHYLKFVRGKTINNVIGRVYAKCWWEQETRQEIVDHEVKYEELDVDDYGDPITSEYQQPALRVYTEPVYGEVPIKDRFNYDIWDQRNVFTDNSYVYSLQDKQFVTFRSEMTLSELEAVKDKNGYFNLDLLKEIDPPDKTEFKSEGADKDQSHQPITSAAEKPYDIYERYGKFWITEDGKPGLDKEGKSLDNAKYEEVITTIAVSGDKRTLIGFRLTHCIDAYGNQYRPIIRGLCYVHLTEDGGIGDGKYTKELQIAIDDTFNVAQDRTMLGTMFTGAINKNAVDDNSTIYLEPGHFMELNDPQKDVKEFIVSDNTVGALQQIAMLTNKMQQVDAIQPPSMGDTGAASTTATAFAGASRATGERSNYKSLTFENTFLCELYWMIQTMTYMFAFPETAIQLMGEKVYDFNPSKDYFYKPLSQSIEPEYSKVAKRKEWTTMFGYAAQIPHPGTVKMLNYIFAEFVKLMGDEYTNVYNKLLDESKPIENQGGGQQMIAGGNSMPMSNQNMNPMSSMEQGARSTSGAY